MKLLSIIIPSYNMEKFLPKSIGSLMVADDALRQTLDIIVVNDGSKDRTSEVAHTFEARYPGVVRVIDKPNGNYGSCINEGLKTAQGKYVKILDADDAFDAMSFPAYLGFLAKTSADVVFTDYVVVDETDRITSSSKCELTESEALLEELPEFFCRGLEMQNVTYRTSSVRSLGYEQTVGISYTDQEWDFYPMAAMRTWAYCPQPLYRYLVGRVGQTMNMSAMRKNRWMLFQISTKLAKLYAALPTSTPEGNRRYLRIRLLRNLWVAFSSGLIVSPRLDDLSALQKLDMFLKDHMPEIYAACADFKSHNALRFPFMRHWRQNYSTRGVPFVVYRLVQSVQAWLRSEGVLR